MGLVLSSSDNKNQTNSVYDIFCIPAGLLRFRAPLVTQPENIRSIIRVDKAGKVQSIHQSDRLTEFSLINTMIVVSGKIILINKQIMITIQFPEFAINYVKVFVTEIGHDLIDIFLLF